MATTAELNDDIRAARVRLSRMRQALEDLDNRIARLERDQRDADARDKVLLGIEIRGATEQKLSALELLTEAETQLAEREAKFGEAVSTAKRELGKTADLCTDAARRFDRAMGEAVAALGEIEAAADPINAFLPRGVAGYTHMRDVSAAFRHAFAERIGKADLQERRSMSERIEMMIADARSNSAGLDRSKAA
jgi:chromosome segregation ATPase